MEGDAWNTYTTFYTHSENICFYFKSQIWQEETEKTINLLGSYTNKLTDVVGSSYEKTKDMHILQNKLNSGMEQSIELNQMTLSHLNVNYIRIKN